MDDTPSCTSGAPRPAASWQRRGAIATPRRHSVSKDPGPPGGTTARSAPWRLSTVALAQSFKMSGKWRNQRGAAAVIVRVRALPSHGCPRPALGLRQPVKKVSGSPLAKLSDSTWVNIFQNPARRRLREPLWKSPGCTWALPRILAPLGSPLRRLWAPRLNTRDVSFKIEAKQESKRCARNLKTICDAVRPEGCQTTYAKGHPRNASPEETCAKDGPDPCTRERFVKHGKHSQEAHCSNLR